LVDLTETVRNVPEMCHLFGNYWSRSVQLRVQTEGDNF